jgi:sortase A
VTLAVIGVFFTVEGSRIYLKAILAQYLLQNAWSSTQKGAAKVKPWPWADTWPVARLISVEHSQKLIVLAGATGRTLAFGPAHLLSSARPGEPGNTVLVGHRDTHFAFLRDLRSGDLLQLESVDGIQHTYQVSDTLVVNENSTEVMTPDTRKMLTLITCYPFDAVVPGGPLRYVVQAFGKVTS